MHEIGTYTAVDSEGKQKGEHSSHLGEHGHHLVTAKRGDNLRELGNGSSNDTDGPNERWLALSMC